FNWAGALAIENQSLHAILGYKVIEISRIKATVQVSIEVPKPSDHVRPGEHDRNCDCLIGRVFCVPAVDRYGETGFTIVVGQNGRELLKHDVRRKFVPLVVEP